MKPRHAAALALVGWYLLQPPWIGPILDLRTPLLKWVNLGAFDSDEQCEHAKADIVNGFKGDLDSAEGKAPDSNDVTTLEAADSAAEMSECVSTDDPRLNRK
jgi:hypothetical protein